LRTSERARNIHALVEVRDQKSNQMARVSAAKALEQISDDSPASSGTSSSPGVVVQIINQVAAQPALMRHESPIGANLLISNDPVQGGE
jgi:hypothetical protein